MDTHSLASSESSTAIDGRAIAAFVHDGGHVTLLVGPSRAELSAVLDQATTELDGRVVRIGNALASPLTLDRILFQVGAMSDGEADPVGFVRERLGAEAEAGPAVVMIEDAQTLSPEALATLAELPHGAEEGRAGLAITLAGRPELLTMLAAPHVADKWAPLTRMTLRRAGTLEAEWPPEPAPDAGGGPHPAGAMGLMSVPPPPLSPSLAVPAKAHGTRRGSAALLLLAGAVAGSLAAGLMLATLGGGDSAGPDATLTVERPPAEVASPAAEPAPEAPLAEASPPAAPAPPEETTAPDGGQAEEPTVSDEQLRKDFNAFLNRAGQDTAGLTPANRATLFQEYLGWRARAKAEAEPAGGAGRAAPGAAGKAGAGQGAAAKPGRTETAP